MDCTIEDKQSKTSKPPTTSVVRTRQSVSHAVFGSPAPLPTNVLPTNGDVGRYFLYCKERSNAGNESVFKAVTTEIIRLWQTASIPTIQQQSVHKRVSQLINKGSQLCRSKSSKNKLTNSSSALRKLFDVCFCLCKNHRLHCCRSNMK